MQEKLADHIKEGPTFSPPLPNVVPPLPHCTFDFLFSFTATLNADGSDSAPPRNVVVVSDDEDSDDGLDLYEERPVVHRAEVHAPPYAAYVVFYGRSTGVFLSMASTLLQVSEFPGAAFLGYPTLSSALWAWEGAVSNKAIGPAAKPCSAQLQVPPRLPSTLSHEISPASPRPSPFLGRYQPPSPLPPALSQRSSDPRFVEVIRGSSASRLRAIKMAFKTEPLPFYAVLRGQRPGVYYGMEAAVNGGGTSIGQVWCMVLTEESANAMFVSTYMRGEVSRI